MYEMLTNNDFFKKKNESPKSGPKSKAQLKKIK